MRHVLLAALVLAACDLTAEPEGTASGRSEVAASQPAPQAELISTHIWQRDDPDFGGFSAIEVDADGLGFIALTDRTFLFEGRFVRDAEGNITDITNGARHRLLDVDGNILRRPFADSEGLAVGPDGTFYIAFEGRARVRQQLGPDGHPSLLPTHPDFERMRHNESLEAIAIGPDGALYVLPERPIGPPDAPFPVYRFVDGEWDIPFSLPRRERFLVTGADIGPDGRLYVVERDFVAIGFRTRVRRFDLDGRGEVILLVTPLGFLDNMEGISVWEDDRGLRMTLIADNNFNPFQRNLIAEYRLPD